jgi:hypothetical protein
MKMQKNGHAFTNAEPNSGSLCLLMTSKYEAVRMSMMAQILARVPMFLLLAKSFDVFR